MLNSPHIYSSVFITHHITTTNTTTVVAKIYYNSNYDGGEQEKVGNWECVISVLGWLVNRKEGRRKRRTLHCDFTRRSSALPAWTREKYQKRTAPSGRSSRRPRAGTESPDGRHSSAVHSKREKPLEKPQDKKRRALTRRVTSTVAEPPPGSTKPKTGLTR